MADDQLRMRAEVVDGFTSPLQKFRRELSSVKAPTALAEMRGQFTGLSKDAATAIETLRSGAGVIRGALGSIGLGAIGFTAAIGGAAAALNGIAGGADRLRRLSVETGMTVNQLRQLHGVAERFGLSQESMNAGIANLQERMYHLRRGRGDVLGRLSSEFGDPELAKRLRATRDDFEALGIIMGRMGQMRDPVQKRALADLFGLGDAWKMTAEGLAEFKRQWADVGDRIGRMPPGAIEDAKKFNEEMRRLRETFDQALLSVGAKALPYVADGVKALGDALKDVDWSKVGKDLGVMFADARAAAQDGVALLKEFRALKEGKVPEVAKDAAKNALGHLSGATQLKSLWDWFTSGKPDDSRRFALERSRDELQRRIAGFDARGETDFAKAARTQLEAILGELKKMNDRTPLFQQQSFNGGGGFGGMIHNASYGGGGSGGGAIYRPPASVMPERNVGGAVSPRGGRGGGAGVIRVNPNGSGRAADAINLMSPLEGMHERFNAGSINGFLKQGGVNIRAAYTAWCAGFVNSALAQVGVKGDGSLIASNFRAWGAKVNPDDVRKGDVLVDHRGRQPGQTGAHVGMATGRTRMRNGQLEIEMLSGNESDKVGRTFYRASGLDIRRALESYSMNRKKVLSDAAPADNGASRLGDDLMRKHYPAQRIESDGELRVRFDNMPKGASVEQTAGTGLFNAVPVTMSRMLGQAPR